MKSFRILCLASLCVGLLSVPLHAQWNTFLSTDDNNNSTNGTGQQTISVAVINSQCFVALINRPIILSAVGGYNAVQLTDSSNNNYLVGYIKATDFTGKVDHPPYSGTGTFNKWISGFDEIPLFRANKAFGTPDSLVYVANNDPDHNILVFKLQPDTTATTDWRMKTGTDDIQGLAVDDNGYVYVCAVNATATNSKEVKVFKGIKAAGSKWGSSYDDTPITTIDLPVGVYRGLAVSNDGKQLWVSNLGNRTVIKYTGSPTTGYTLASGFAWTESKNDTIPGTAYDTLGTQAWDIGRPIGMGYLKGNNLLFVATARWLSFQLKAHNTSNSYTYSKIVMLNPNTGKAMDSLDIAKYYYQKSDTNGVNNSYTLPVTGDVIHIAGYASAYDIGFDEKKNLYSQSMYGWSVEGWKYTGTLPTIPSTGVQRVDNVIPAGYDLTTNYPNPFNPSTRFHFSIPQTQFVSVKVFDLLGREVAALVNETMHPGTYTVEWIAGEMPSGVYLYQIQAGPFVATKKMTLMK